MTGSRAGVAARALGLAVLLGVGALASARVSFDGDVGRLVPADGDTRRALAALRSFPATDVLLVLVDGREDPARLREATLALAEDLRALDGVAQVQAGFDLAQGAVVGERLADHAAALVPAEALAARLAPDGIREALTLQRERLAGPAGAFLEGRILRDPLDLEGLAVAHTTGGLRAGVTLRDGLLTNAAGTVAMVVVEPAPRAGPAEDEAFFAAVEGALGRAALPALPYGGPAFAAEAARSIQADVAAAGLASALVLALVLVAGFRSWRPLAGTVPAVLVAGAGAAVGAALTSPVHPIQLGFSGALAGIAADYWLHLHLGVAERPGQVDAASRYRSAVEEVRELLPTLVLNAGATSLACAVLVASDVPAVRVLGVTGIGTAVAALVATAVAGPLTWAVIGRPATSAPAERPVSPLLATAAALLLGLLAVRAGDAGLDADPMHLLARSPAVARATALLEGEFGLSEARAVVVLEDADPERLRDRAARVEEALAKTGIAAPVGPGALLPGPAALAARRAAAPPEAALQAEIDRIAGELGFAPFPGAAARIHAALSRPLPADLWAGTPLAAHVRAHVAAGEGVTRALVSTPLPDPVAEPFLADTVRAADPEARWFVPSVLAQDAIEATSAQLLRAAVVGGALLFAAFAVRYRAMDRALAAVAPGLAAVLGAAGALGWAGVPWNLVTVTILVLVVGFAVDYGVFLTDAREPARRAVAARAVALSAGTTLAGFLPLVAARTPALRSVGLVLTAGIGAAAVAAVFVTPALVAGWPSPRARSALARLAWAGALAVNLDVLLIALTAFTPPPLPPLAPGPGRLVRDEGLWLLSTAGDAATAGADHGRLTAHLRPRLEREMLASFHQHVPYAPFRWLVTRGAALVGSGLPRHLRGEDAVEIAATAAADPDLLWLGGPHYTRKVYYHAIHDLGQALVDTPLLGCTGFVAGPAATRDGHVLLGRNFDFEGGIAFDRDKVVRVHRPAEGIPYLSVAFAGISGAVTGVNAAGIAVAINAAASDTPPVPGTPMTLIVREILETARSLDDAERILRARTGFVAENVLVVDADAGRTAVFEVDAAHVVRVEVTGAHAVANHFVSETFAADAHNRSRMEEGTTVPRARRLQELLDRSAGALDLPAAARLLRDRRGVGDAPLARGHRWALDADLATHGVIVDATARVVWVSRFPNLAGGYAEISLPAALAGDLDAREVVPADPDAARALGVRRGRELLRAARRAAPAEAMAKADAAAALLPGHPEALFEQGRARAAAGDAAAARPFLEAALAAEPEYAEQRRAIAELLR